ncbi:hypothetical protein SAMN05216554_1653 [Herbiconiux ginsengi]|uniref:Uncharacterized protein n=1 Tax=Herbiconiux ginsengi TaxID=381665 RepID=A0A1H3N1C6_9MICO|nr:hypothetical protein SAMN05216554_1653 [Herbiconiux ginsengi]
MSGGGVSMAGMDQREMAHNSGWSVDAGGTVRLDAVDQPEQDAVDQPE